MVNKKQESQKQNRREFLTSSVAGAGAGLLVLGTSQTAKGKVVTQPGRGRIARNWKLKHHENFGKPLPVDSAPWVRDPLGEDSPWHVDGPRRQNDAGDFFKIHGGENFERHVNSFDLLRKRVPFGDNDWLTAEVAARDYEKDGTPENPPSLRNVTIPHGGRAALIDEPSHAGGLLIRSTDALPRHYRIEYTLRTIDFGGMRNGDFRYNGKFNGYDTEGCKTEWPWKGGGDFSGPANMCNPNFGGVRYANGFYFLTIVDYPNPAPHNNIFVHHHRKVNMDAYNTIGGDQYDICNPATGERYNYGGPKSTHNAINELFITPDEGAGNNFISETECGTFIQGQADPILVSAAEIKPELMPKQSYQFAIERDETGYTMEMSGNFRFIGQATLRYHRDFIQNGYPIWHYNNTPGEYEGQFNDSFTMEGKYGNYTVDDMWPDDSAYPDYFIIGDPHLTHYEGKATVDDIRLYVPK